jgi:predicted DNA-binding transcriptional regulator YafY
MSSTSSRMLKLLSLLQARADWTGPELAERLEVSARTLRRDVDSLRAMGYRVETSKGPYGGYRLGAGKALPPLVFDAEQAVAIGLALRTAPAAVTGIGEGTRRALATLRQVMPPTMRNELDAFDVTPIWNPWDFAGPPVAASSVSAVGTAIRARQILTFDYEPGDGDGPARGARDATPVRVEPHHLALWAGRWYLVAFAIDLADWMIYRLDRVRPHPSSGHTFTPRTPPYDSVADYVMNHHDRGDTPAKWQCRGSAVLHLPANVVARWAPGGSVIEAVDDDRSRLTLGAWSWAGIAGLLSTFDTDLEQIEPSELRRACGLVASRLTAANNSLDVKRPRPPDA